MADGGNNEKFSYVYAFRNPLDTLNFRLKSLDECLPDGLIVLDANVLLLPFKTGPHALDEIEKALIRLKNEKRLFVPEHALREYIANRPTKIKEFFEQLNKQRSKDYTVPSSAKLIEKVEAYPRLLDAEKRIKDEIENFKKLIGDAIEEVRNWTTNDPVSKMYQRVFSNDIVSKLGEGLAELDKEHKERNQKALPPGYKDSTKAQNSVGDFLIWKTILSIGEINPSRDLIFVSGEEKSDWVYRGSNEVLYAREELIEEYRDISKGGSFHLVDFATLLKYLNASDKAVAEIQVMEEKLEPLIVDAVIDGTSSPMKWSEFARIAEESVGQWLVSTVGKENVSRDSTSRGVDYVAYLPQFGIEHYIEVRAIREYKNFRQRVREISPYLSAILEAGSTRKGVKKVQAGVIFVCDSKDGAYYIEEAKRGVTLPEEVFIRAGYLEDDKFIAV